MSDPNHSIMRSEQLLRAGAAVGAVTGDSWRERSPALLVPTSWRVRWPDRKRKSAAWQSLVGG